MLPPVDVAYIADELDRLGEEIQRAFEESVAPVEPHPDIPLLGLQQLLDALRSAEAETPDASALALRNQTGGEPEVLLDHGLELLSQLSDVAERLGLPQSARAVERLSLPLACWLLRRGSELPHPEQVVNAAAALANSLREPDELAGLYALMSEVVNGVSPQEIHRVDDPSPARPWRVLLLNRAIVATRSHRPALMTEAFDAVIEHLPEDAPEFFREGMGQMEALNYPTPVREVMQRYYERWCSGQRLH